MSDLPKLGSRDQLPPNDTTIQQTGRNGLVTFYPFGTDQNRPAVISINGDNGAIDIGGTRDKDGKLLLRDKQMTITYIIDGETGTASQSGDIVLFDANGCERVRISGKTADVTLKSPAGDVIAHLDGKSGALTLGGNGQGGDVILRDAAANETVRLTGAVGEISAGGNGQNGNVVVNNLTGNETLRLAGGTAAITVGGNGQGGTIAVRNPAGGDTLRLDGSAGNLALGGNGQDGDVIVMNTAGSETIRLAGGAGDITVGGNGQGGDVIVRDATANEAIRLAGSTSDITVGGNGQSGDVIVRNSASIEAIRLAGSTADITVGSNGQGGDVIVRDATAKETIRLAGSTADITVGGNGQDGDMVVKNAAGTETIRLNGQLGDIILSNADAAEQFDLLELASAVPGTVMVLNEVGKLQPSSVAYDSKVVGVVAGAGHYRPGIVLDRRGAPDARVTISMLGKVSCKADATYGPIEVGNLLTTSPTTGHAMKASDMSRALGAVIGKALSPLREGVGLVDVLITLQ